MIVIRVSLSMTFLPAPMRTYQPRRARLVAHRPPLARPGALIVGHHALTQNLFCNPEYFLAAPFSRKNSVNTVSSLEPSFDMMQMNCFTSSVVLTVMVRITLTMNYHFILIARPVIVNHPRPRERAFC
jgi:hypothetical protein